MLFESGSSFGPPEDCSSSWKAANSYWVSGTWSIDCIFSVAHLDVKLQSIDTDQKNSHWSSWTFDFCLLHCWLLDWSEPSCGHNKLLLFHLQYWLQNSKLLLLFKVGQLFASLSLLGYIYSWLIIIPLIIKVVGWATSSKSRVFIVATEWANRTIADCQSKLFLGFCWWMEDDEKG